MTASIMGVSGTPSTRRGQLALLLQELLTATARLRASGSDAPADVESFRGQVKRLIAAATQEGRNLGYHDDDFGFGLFAVVAFLDESILSLQLPAFRAWVGQPLSLELFGAHLGGESFFQYLETLLRRDDSEDVADTLEVFLLCLHLGFRGKYGSGHSEEPHVWTGRVRERIERIRGAPAAFSPEWAPPRDEKPQRSTDPWQRRLLIAAATAIGIIIVLFIVFKLVLSSGVGSLASPV